MLEPVTFSTQKQPTAIQLNKHIRVTCQNEGQVAKPVPHLLSFTRKRIRMCDEDRMIEAFAQYVDLRQSKSDESTRLIYSGDCEQFLTELLELAFDIPLLLKISPLEVRSAQDRVRHRIEMLIQNK